MDEKVRMLRECYSKSDEAIESVIDLIDSLPCKRNIEIPDSFAVEALNSIIYMSYKHRNLVPDVFHEMEMKYKYMGYSDDEVLLSIIEYVIDDVIDIIRGNKEKKEFLHKSISMMDRQEIMQPFIRLIDNF